MKISEISIEDRIYQEALELRYDLFFREHGLPRSILFDDLEADSIHIAMTDESGLVAYGRLSPIGNGEFVVSQMVVRPACQGKGYGSQVLARIIQTAISQEARILMLEARIPAISMYEKQGFIRDGSVYESHSTGVPHIKMVFHAGP